MQITANIYTNPDSTYPAVFKPYKFDISQYGEKTRKKLEFTITNITDEKFNLALVDMPAGMFKVSLPKSVKPGKSAKGKIELTDEYISEQFEKSITVEFSGKETTRFTIPVKRVIRIPGEKVDKVKPARKTKAG
ncbi:MAG: DUF1573 domain-containing protein [candidate division Zixibacteria bacterium]|nr:DUF1573 domain-containing protein [candidate division Zixibacteria bacterium]